MSISQNGNYCSSTGDVFSTSKWSWIVHISRMQLSKGVRHSGFSGLLSSFPLVGWKCQRWGRRDKEGVSMVWFIPHASWWICSGWLNYLWASKLNSAKRLFSFSLRNPNLIRPKWDTHARASLCRCTLNTKSGEFTPKHKKKSTQWLAFVSACTQIHISWKHKCLV